MNLLIIHFSITCFNLMYHCNRYFYSIPFLLWKAPYPTPFRSVTVSALSFDVGDVLENCSWDSSLEQSFSRDCELFSILQSACSREQAQDGIGEVPDFSLLFAVSGRLTRFARSLFRNAFENVFLTAIVVAGWPSLLSLSCAGMSSRRPCFLPSACKCAT